MNFEDITPKQWVMIGAGALGLLLLMRGGGGQQQQPQRTESLAEREMRLGYASGLYMTPQMRDDYQSGYGYGNGDFISKLIDALAPKSGTQPAGTDGTNPETGPNLLRLIGRQGTWGDVSLDPLSWITKASTRAGHFLVQVTRPEGTRFIEVPESRCGPGFKWDHATARCVRAS